MGSWPARKSLSSPLSEPGAWESGQDVITGLSGNLVAYGPERPTGVTKQEQSPPMSGITRPLNLKLIDARLFHFECHSCQMICHHFTAALLIEFFREKIQNQSSRTWVEGVVGIVSGSDFLEGELCPNSWRVLQKTDQPGVLNIWFVFFIFSVPHIEPRCGLTTKPYPFSFAYFYLQTVSG